MARRSLFLRRTETTVTPLASLTLGHERRSRISADSGDLDIVSVDSRQVALRRPDCLFIGDPTPAHIRERSSGTETLRPPRLRPAPNTVPATEVDPLSFSMAGAWAIEPAGGLRRIRRCDSEDE